MPRISRWPEPAALGVTEASSGEWEGSSRSLGIGRLSEAGGKWGVFHCEMPRRETYCLDMRQNEITGYKILSAPSRAFLSHVYHCTLAFWKISLHVETIWNCLILRLSTARLLRSLRLTEAQQVYKTMALGPFVVITSDLQEGKLGNIVHQSPGTWEHRAERDCLGQWDQSLELTCTIVYQILSPFSHTMLI